jgi:methylmalonyl-CoA mutase
VQRYLDAITECCKSGNGNLLDLTVEAARARATVGEITDAMEKVYGRHTATGRLVSGAYKTEYGDAEEITRVMKRVEVNRCEFVIHCLLQDRLFFMDLV